MEGRPLDDSELVERAQRGDVDAYEELVRRYQGIAHRTAYLVTGRAAEAEDAAQVAFTKAYYALGRFRAGAPFRPWLLQIVANEARNQRRSAGRRPGLELRLAEDRPRVDAAPSPEAAVLASEPRQELVAAFNKLRPLVSCNRSSLTIHSGWETMTEWRTVPRLSHWLREMHKSWQHVHGQRLCRRVRSSELA
ncbi:MAG: RNA polymerase sigma factor [Actinomycetota bacterium]